MELARLLRRTCLSRIKPADRLRATTLGGICMANEIVTARKGPVLEITLNRPEIGNAASDGMAVELTKLLLGAAESSEIVVLRGAGDDFCVGRETMGERPPRPATGCARAARRNDVVFNCYGAFRRCEIPIIGVVQGAPRLRLRHCRGLRHHPRRRQRQVSGSGNGAQHHADHGDVGAGRSRAAQGHDLSGLVHRRDHPARAREPGSRAKSIRRASSMPRSMRSASRS